VHVSEHQRRVGEVARATGLTIRALHHYDEIGLLVPSERSEAGYRLYGEADVERLYRILALREMGFALEDIGALLDREGSDLRPAVRRHLEQLDERLRLGAQLRARLTRILELLDQAGEPSADLLFEAIEVMTRMDSYYTPEQRAQIQARAEALGAEGLKRAEQDWATLIAEVEAERVAGTDPADPRLTPLIERWNDLIAQFTGGDAGIRESVRRIYENEGAEKASRGALDTATMEYARRAMEARGAG
jgi:DNA-binding transcriptional MerR regulator